jgi:excisionase family DNA binding protein
MSGVFTIREVARRLRLSTATVYKLCSEGSLEHFRVMNSIRVREDALTAFVAVRSRSRNSRSPQP